MNHTRILVTVKYISKFQANLIAEDGSVFKTIRVNEPFTIGNQMREWVPEYNYSDHKIHCRKYGNSGNVIEEFYLPSNRKVLWAISSGAARRGVVHIYREPKDELDAALQKLGVGRDCIEIVDGDTIDTTLWKGGCSCHHVQNPYEYFVHSDCYVDLVHEGEYVDSSCENQYHRGCKAEPDLNRYYDGTYAIQYYRTGGSVSSSTSDRIVKIVMTKNANRKEMYETICRYYGGDKFMTE